MGRRCRLPTSKKTLALIFTGPCNGKLAAVAWSIVKAGSVAAHRLEVGSEFACAGCTRIRDHDGQAAYVTVLYAATDRTTVHCDGLGWAQARYVVQALSVPSE